MAEWTKDADGNERARILGYDFRVSHGSTVYGRGWYHQVMKGGGMWGFESAPLDSAEGAKADAESYALHLEQLKSLPRETNSFGRSGGTSTRWGKAQNSRSYTRGVTFYSTAGHGGFKVSATMNAMIPDHLRLPDGWYEEDCEWARVALGLPHLFTDREKAMAEKSLMSWNPEAWETHFGRVLQPGESVIKDEKQFHIDHANDWVVISAVTSDEDPNMVNVTASIGGRRGEDIEHKEFVVPKDDYSKRSRFGFVVDPERHQEKDAASTPTIH